MIYLFKKILSSILRVFKSKAEREFFRLYSKRKMGFTDISFFDYNFVIIDYMSFVWQFKEIFVDEIYKFESFSKNIVIYDCGANIGMSLLYFKMLYPNSRIVAFEPNDSVADCLQSNIHRNKLSNIELLRKAVWVDDCEISFGLDDADGSSIYHDANRIQVAAIRLKKMLENESVIDLLKIDIEGAEYSVLCDCSRSLSNVKNIFIEYHSFKNNEQHLSMILSILEKNGFRYNISSLGQARSPFILVDDNRTMDLQLNIFGRKCS